MFATTVFGGDLVCARPNL